MKVTLVNMGISAARAAATSTNKDYETIEPLTYAAKIIEDLGHTSVAEHNVFQLKIEDISRVAAEVIGRRKYIHIVEESQRYVEPHAFTFSVPGQEDTLACYRWLRDRGHKKEIARYVLPMNIATNMFITIEETSLAGLVCDLQDSAKYYGTFHEQYHHELWELSRLLKAHLHHQSLIAAQPSTPHYVLELDHSTTMAWVETPTLWKSIPQNHTHPQAYWDMASVHLMTRVSSVIYQQLKRYRTSNTLVGPYGPMSFPHPDFEMPIIKESISRLQEEYLFAKGSYLSNAHTLAIYMKMPLTSALNMLEQRLDAHAQPQIRELMQVVANALFAESKLMDILSYTPWMGSNLRIYQTKGAL